MEKINITLNEVVRKHIKITLYLAVSAGLAYIIAVLTDKPEAVYLTPIINYLIFALKQELDREGYFQALRQK